MLFYILILGIVIFLISTKCLLLNEEFFILISFFFFLIYSFKNILPQISNSINNEVFQIKYNLLEFLFNFKNHLLVLKTKLAKYSISQSINKIKNQFLDLVKQNSYILLYNFIYKTKFLYLIKFSMLLAEEENYNKIIYDYFCIETKIIIQSKIMHFFKKKLIENQELILKL